MGVSWSTTENSKLPAKNIEKPDVIDEVMMKLTIKLGKLHYFRGDYWFSLPFISLILCNLSMFAASDKIKFKCGHSGD